MIQSLGFVDPEHPNHVCKLKRSLYGLTQALCQWFYCLCDAFICINFIGPKTDTSLFFYYHSYTLNFYLIYINNIILTCNNTSHIQTVVSTLQHQFAL